MALGNPFPPSTPPPPPVQGFGIKARVPPDMGERPKAAQTFFLKMSGVGDGQMGGLKTCREGDTVPNQEPGTCDTCSPPSPVTAKYFRHLCVRTNWTEPDKHDDSGPLQV